MVLDAEQALRQMVGVSPDASLGQLRSGYDLAVHRATRAGDHQHALALSRAYDRLPSTTRDRLYPSSRTPGALVLPSHRSRQRRRASRPAPPIRRPRVRVVVYGTLAAVTLGLAAAGAAQHYRHQPSDPQPVPRPVGRADMPTAPTMRTGARPVIVPTNAPTGANGLVTLVCQPEPGSDGYSMTAPRGAIVACSNAAVPSVVG